MGDPRRLKNKYARPRMPWKQARIEEERALMKEYGLKNKSEIWKLSSQMKRFADQAKKLIAATGPQAEKERMQLIQKLCRLGLVQKTAKLDDVLGLTLKNFLDRRLQTIVLKKGLATTPKQARQFIVHEHIAIANKKITSPSYLVLVDEEPKVSFVAKSALSNPDHPARTIRKKQKPKKIQVKPKRGKKA